MSEPRYPNESQAYRDARAALLKDEQELVDKVKAVAEKRRKLPPGGQLKENYVFHWANEGKVGKSVTFSELFGDKSTLLLYSFMFGPGWDKPCPSCTSLMDGFDRSWYQVSRNAAFAAIAKAPAERIEAWAKERGWSQIPLLSGSQSPYQADYKCQGANDDMQWPVMHVFEKKDGRIFHFWGTELPGNHVDTVWPYWNLMDFTPQGRPDIPTPPQKIPVRVFGEELSECGIADRLTCRALAGRPLPSGERAVRHDLRPRDACSTGVDGDGAVVSHSANRVRGHFLQEGPSSGRLAEGKPPA